MREIDNIFGFAKLQDTLTVIKTIEEKGYTVEDLVEYIPKRQAEFDTKTLGEPLIRPCPECTKPLGLSQVNNTNRTQTGDESKTVWYCNQCHFEEFSALTIQEQIEKYVNS